MTDNIGSVLAVALAAILIVSGAAPVAAQDDQPEAAIVVDLAADGSATVTARLTYDLQGDTEQAAFEDLRSDEQAREQLRTQFRDRMQRVANDAASVTDREMAVTDGSIDISVVETTGVVELSVNWDGLAAVENDRLTVTEPFASGFGLDRPVVVHPPDGYTVSDVSPSPDVDDGTVRWEADTNLDGFEVTLEPTTAGTDTSGPGFGPIAALIGIGSLAVALRRR